MGLVGHVTMTLSGRSRSRARRSDDFAQTVGKNCDPTKGWGRGRNRSLATNHKGDQTTEAIPQQRLGPGNEEPAGHGGRK